MLLSYCNNVTCRQKDFWRSWESYVMALRKNEMNWNTGNILSIQTSKSTPTVIHFLQQGLNHSNRKKILPNSHIPNAYKWAITFKQAQYSTLLMLYTCIGMRLMPSATLSIPRCRQKAILMRFSLFVF